MSNVAGDERETKETAWILSSGIGIPVVRLPRLLLTLGPGRIAERQLRPGGGRQVSVRRRRVSLEES